MPIMRKVQLRGERSYPLICMEGEIIFGIEYDVPEILGVRCRKNDNNENTHLPG